MRLLPPGRREPLLLGAAGLAVLLGLLLIPPDPRPEAYTRPAADPRLTYPPFAWRQGDGRPSPEPGRLVHLVTSESPFTLRFRLVGGEAPQPPEGGVEAVLWTPRARERLRLAFRPEGPPGCVRVEMVWTEGLLPSPGKEEFVACGAGEGLRVALGRGEGTLWAEVRWEEGGRRLSIPLRGRRLLWHREGALTVSLVAWGEGGGFRLEEARVGLPGAGRYYAYARPGAGQALTLLIGLAALGALLPGLARGTAALGRRPLRPLLLLGGLGMGAALLAAPLAWGAGSLGRLPFDALTFQVNALFAYGEGLRSAYPGPDTVPLAGALNGSPLFSASSRYPPLSAYLFWLAGLLAEALLRDPFAVLPNPGLEWVFRWLFLLLHLALAGLVFGLVRVRTGSARRALAAAGLVGLNPALFLATVPWVQNDGLALLLALAGWGLLALGGRPWAGWTCLLAALLVKPLVLPAAVAAGPYSLRRYGPRATAGALLRAGLLAVALLLPFWAQGYHLRMLALPLVRRLLLESPAWHPVSFDAYTVWTGVTALLGYGGLARLAAPAEAGPILSLGPISLLLSPRTGFYALGAALTALHLWALTRPGVLARPATAFLLVGTYWVSLALLSTGTSGRYLTAALPFLAVAWGLAGPRALLPLLLAALSTLSGGFSVLGALAHAAVRIREAWYGPTLLHGPAGLLLFRLWQDDGVINLFSGLAGLAVVLCAGAAWRLGRREERLRAPEPGDRGAKEPAGPPGR